MTSQIVLRQEVRPDDVLIVGNIAASSGFFSHMEVEIAKELVTEALNNGADSGYFFIFAEVGGETAAFACHGPDTENPRKHHLYWIAVHESHRGHGLGSILIDTAEHNAWAAGADILAVETSSRDQYAPTRNFYEEHGYTRKEARRNHYGPGDHMLVYLKSLDGELMQQPGEDHSEWDQADA